MSLLNLKLFFYLFLGYAFLILVLEIKKWRENYSLNFYACMRQIKVRSVFQVLFNKNIANFIHNRRQKNQGSKFFGFFDRTFS